MTAARWYLRPEKYRSIIRRFGVSEDEYQSLAANIVEAFPDEWISAQLVTSRYTVERLHPLRFTRLSHNPVPDLLGRYCGGYVAIAEIIRLGRLLRTCKEQGLAKRMRPRLRLPADGYIGALFELEVLDRLLASGFHLVAPPETDGVDFTLNRSGVHLFVEVSHRGASAIAALEYEIMARTLDSAVERQTEIRRDILLILKAPAEQLRTFTDEIAEKVVQAEVGLLDRGFRHPKELYNIEVRESETGLVRVRWGPEDKSSVED